MINETKFDAIWDKVKQDLESKIESTEYNTFVSNTQLVNLDEGKAIILVSGAVAKALITTKYYDLISDTLNDVSGTKFECLFKTQEEVSSISHNDVKNMINEVNFVSNLQKDLTFENYIVGKSNNEAYTGSVAAAAKPGVDWNPLFIYGDSGLGKTHLIHAIGNKVLHDSGNTKKVIYISAEDFRTRYIESLKDKSIDDFKKNLFSADVLLIDDVQFFSGSKQTGDTFFEIFNTLINLRKQIVLTSDKHPVELNGLEDRLVSRFNSGLSVPVSTPTIDLAKSIILSKIEKINFGETKFTDEAVFLIAENNHTDVRSIEGALNRLSFLNTLNMYDVIDVKVVAEAFDQEDITTKLSVSKIKSAVSNYYGIDSKQLASNSRKKQLVNARHIAVWFTRQYLEYSYTMIGNEFGRRDHSTIMSSWKKINNALLNDELMKKAISDIKGMLKISK